MRAFGGRAPRSSFSKYKFPQGEKIWNCLYTLSHMCIASVQKFKTKYFHTWRTEKRQKRISKMGQYFLLLGRIFVFSYSLQITTNSNNFLTRSCGNLLSYRGILFWIFLKLWNINFDFFKIPSSLEHGLRWHFPNANFTNSFRLGKRIIFLFV